MRDLLLEIGVEELPARFIDPSREALARRVAELLQQSRLDFGEVKGYATPRRLAVLVKDVAEEQPDTFIERRGPSRSVGQTPDGQFTAAARGFARSQGVDVEQLELRATPQGEYFFAVRREAGRPARELLPELLRNAITSLTFPKSMRWGDGELRFARPIRWLVALFGEEVIPFELAGVRSGRETRGHRQLGPGPIVLNRPDEYVRVLAEAGVIVDSEERRRRLIAEVERAAREAGGRADLEPELVDEVVNLVEYPTAFVGSFPAEYLSLPEAVIITPMRHHQRYFPVRGENGKLLPVFVGVRNGGTRNLAGVAAGNERVLRARLDDARFYFNEDCKQPLSAYGAKLAGIVFQERLGSLADKRERLVKLVRQLGEKLGESAGLSAAELETAARAAELAKADLATRMVGEFPELEGIIGQEYALRSGESEAVAIAIGEQYRPRGAGDELPTSRAGALLSVADRFDTLAGYFAVGLIPTGSQDPYALRRQALGLLRILLEFDWHLNAIEAAQQALRNYPRELLQAPAPATGERSAGADVKGRQPAGPMSVAGTYGEEDRIRAVAGQLWEFLADRLRGILTAKGIRYDLVEAALAAGEADPAGISDRASALSDAVEKDAAGDLENLAAAYGRVYRILEQAGSAGWRPGPVDPAYLTEDAERALWEAVAQASTELEQLAARGRWAAAIALLSRLRQPIDLFFDRVLVMAPDERVRNNRLNLLFTFRQAAGRIAAFEKVVTGKVR
ncbi:MAG: glycine--tRNA ligase subunit beta [Limnochordales bacterium]|nr:glycine--tRNA ligase subunit beta [Limnochordales bacterium]